MDMWCDNNGGNKVFWFEETKGGNQKLVRPDGTTKLMKRKNEFFLKKGVQCHSGWQRSILLMEEYDFWDCTAFGCTINTMFAVKPNRMDDSSYIGYIFTSCEHAENVIYPYLSPELVDKCRENVNAFYSSPNLQAAWHNFILHPVCLLVDKNLKEFIPVSIESIGCGEKILGEYTFNTVYSLEDKEGLKFAFKTPIR